MAYSVASSWFLSEGDFVVHVAWYYDLAFGLRGGSGGCWLIGRFRFLAVALGGFHHRDLQWWWQNLEHCRRTFGPTNRVELHRKAVVAVGLGVSSRAELDDRQ